MSASRDHAHSTAGRRFAAITIAALILAGCVPAPSGNPEDIGERVGGVGEMGIYHACDPYGRAVYVANGYKQGGLVVIERAAECAPSSAERSSGRGPGTTRSIPKGQDQ